MRESIVFFKYEKFSYFSQKETVMSALPILVVGGSGKTGARVDARLRARGIATRPVSRTSAVRFDWAAP